MSKQIIDKYSLNLAGEYRVAAELCLRGLYTSVTYGNKKGADLYAIGENRRAAVIEVKASQSSRFVTCGARSRVLSHSHYLLSQLSDTKAIPIMTMMQ
jgi:hypothetical protein